MAGEDKRQDYEPAAFWEDRYSSLDLTRSGHRDLPEAYNRWLYRRKQAVLQRTLAAAGFDPRGKRVLEVGVGTGAYLDHWQQAGVGHVAGVDLSAAAVSHARGRYPEFAFMQRDLTEPDLASACGRDFDLVAALDVLYHVTDDARLAQALRNVHDVLKPRGLFALHDQFLHRPTEHHSYIRWRSLDDWQAALAAAGFDVVARVPIFFVMIQPNDCRTSTGTRLMTALWSCSARVIQRLPSAAGAVAYLIDSTLGTVVAEGPSMELMLVRRRG
jgi:SAM-dependent methyltransferase